jgi:hypothetical protein
MITGHEVHAGDEDATIAWTTDAPAKGMVRYRRSEEGSEWSEKRVSDLTRAHFVRIEGLRERTRYEFEIAVTTEGSGSATAAGVFETK